MSHMNGDVGGAGDNPSYRLFILFLGIIFFASLLIIALKINPDRRSGEEKIDEQRKIEKKEEKRETTPKIKGVIMVVFKE